MNFEPETIFFIISFNLLKIFDQSVISKQLASEILL